ncbi:ferritin-like domain-containing protein [Clostridium magnum]|uniref:Rubrerythrin n=1 Tax=Clostridium magnum DSM 2767 TaxID=1121326 RepID=A0A162THX2_9CLOT|nr:ferritin-like domain-containing protein [Clostridium magnum]KZL92665.1 rubrerythrin [Clostridium magnum DSM 2767]SHI24295.1 Rubrerythrin [Clostridium magnum DSM 2767]
MPYINYSMMYNNALQNSLNLVKEAVSGEREDELFYDYLISVAPSKEEKDIIASIRDDERKHNVMFRRIYKAFTGMDIPSGGEETFQKPSSYLDGIKRALFGELKAVEKYREIRKGLPMGPYRDVLFEIITDELKHASKYNYLYTNNAMTMNIMTMNMVRQTAALQPDLSKYSPDELVKYITPLVNRALAESKAGINLEHLLQEFILSGVLVGLGKKPMDAIDEVEKWEKTGESKILEASKKNRF